MKHHIKLVYEDDGSVSPVDGEFYKNLINVGDVCVFSTPDNKEIRCIASLDEGAVCNNCVFEHSKYPCSGATSFRCANIEEYNRPGISYVPIDMLLESV